MAKQKEITCKEVTKLSGGKWDKMHDISRRVYSVDYIAPTLHTAGGGNTEVKIAEPITCAMRGRNPENPSCRDAGVATEQRVELGGDVANCITTVQKDSLVAEPIIHEETIGGSELKRQLCNSLLEQGLIDDGDVIRHSYTNSRMQGEMKDIKQKGLCPTLDTRCDCLGVCQDYRIRKLTPKECFRLMGVKDRDFERVAQNQSTSSLYHLAGDSIVTACLMAIFGQMMPQLQFRTKVAELPGELMEDEAL